MKLIIRHIISVVAIAAVATTAMSADDVKDVSGEFYFEGNGTESRIDCERIALEGARIDAINKAFGKSVSQVITQHETVSSRGDNSYVDYLSQTELRGTWISDTSKPEYTYSLDENGNYRVSCRIRGKARKANNEAIDFEATVMRNSPDKRHTATQFESGDMMYAGFCSPVDGYLSIYLIDDMQNVYRLLPYRAWPDGTIKVKGKKDYIFFDPADNDLTYGAADPMELVTDGEMERNRLAFIFSPNSFSKPMDRTSDINLPDMLSLKDYNRWVARAKTNDPKLTIREIAIDIKGK